MHSGRNFIFIVICPGHGAPLLSSRNPEQLRWRILQAGQFLFGTVSFNPFVICEIGLFDATIVRNVLALRIDAVQLKRKQRKKSNQYIS